MMDRINKIINKVVSFVSYKGFWYGGNVFVSHLLFIDDMHFYWCNRKDALLLKSFMRVFFFGTVMVCNALKSSLSLMNTNPQDVIWHTDKFGFSMVNISIGLKYLGFNIKPNDYICKDWSWMIIHIEKILNSWCNKWLSCGGIFLMIYSISEVILVF